MDSNQFIEQAKILYSESKYQDVVNLLNTIEFEGHNNIIDSNRLLAYSYYHLREFAESLKCFSIMKRNNVIFGAKDNLRIGQAFYNTNNLSKAVEYLNYAYEESGEVVFENQDLHYLNLVKDTSSLAVPKKRYMNSSQTKDIAKILLKGNWLKFVGINSLLLIILFATYLIWLFYFSYNIYINFTNIILILILILFSYIFSGGLNAIYLHYVKNKELDLSKYFCFFSIKILKQSIPLLLIFILICMTFFIQPLLTTILLVPFFYIFALFQYTLYDINIEKRAISKNIIIENYKLMKGQKSRLFILVLSFFGWTLLLNIINLSLINISGDNFILIILSMFVYLLMYAFFMSYQTMSFVVFYCELTSNQFEKGEYLKFQSKQDLSIRSNYPQLINNLVQNINDNYNLEQDVQEDIKSYLREYTSALHNNINYFTKSDNKQTIINENIDYINEKLSILSLPTEALVKIEVFVFDVASDYGFVNQEELT